MKLDGQPLNVVYRAVRYIIVRNNERSPEVYKSACFPGGVSPQGARPCPPTAGQCPADCLVGFLQVHRYAEGDCALSWGLPLPLHA